MSDKKVPTWAWVGGIGCLVLIIVVAIAGTGGYYWLKNTFTEASGQLVELVDEDYQKFLMEAKVPEEYANDLDKLLEIAKRPETSSMAKMLSVGVISSSIQDNAISEDESAAVKKLVNFLGPDSARGFKAMGTFMEENPEIQRLMEQLSENAERPRGDGAASKPDVSEEAEDVGAGMEMEESE